MNTGLVNLCVTLLPLILSISFSKASIYVDYSDIYCVPLEYGSLGSILDFEELGYGYTQGIGCFEDPWSTQFVSFILFGNDGTGSFNMIESIDFVSMPTPLAGDFNGDGYTDLFAYVNGPYSTVCLTYLRNQYGFGGGVVFWPPFLPEGIDVGDFNDDSFADICGTTEGRIFLWSCDGAGHFSSVIASDSLGITYDSKCSDFDNDGDLDLLVRSSDTLYIMRNNGSGYFDIASGFSLQPFYYLTSICISDLNNDTLNDIVLVSSNSSYETVFYTYMNTGDLNFTESLDILLGLLPYYATVAKIDFDEFPDLAIYLSSTFGIYRGHGDGTFESLPSLFSSEDVTAAHFVDYNQDNALDMSAICSDGNTYLRMYPNNNSSISEHSSQPLTSTLLSAATNPFHSSVTLYLSNSFTPAILEVFDMSGNVVASISTDESGIAIWNGTNARNEALPNGCYVIRVKGIYCNPIKLLKIS